ncbi:MAG: hypothetical protein ACI4MC_03425 [Candidatus Coproplasma sp.]
MKKKIISLLLAATVAVAACGIAGCNGGNSDDGKYSLDFKEQTSSWTKTTKNDVTYYGAEVVRYCANPTAPAKQCLNIYVPEEYLNADGTINASGERNGYTSSTAPILYINSVGAYQGFSPYKLNSTSTLAGQNA